MYNSVHVKGIGGDLRSKYYRLDMHILYYNSRGGISDRKAGIPHNYVIYLVCF